MSSENVLRFFEALAGDPVLHAKVQAAGRAAAHEAAQQIAALSIQAGVPFTAEEYLAVFPSGPKELSEDQLQSAAGGVKKHGDESNYSGTRPEPSWPTW